MPNFSRRTVIKSAAVIGALQIGSPFAAKTTEAAQAEGAVAGPKSAVSLHVGWYELHPDVSLNFQLNRWAAYGGPRWVADVRPMIGAVTDYDSWRDTFVMLGERAASEGRMLDAALHFRSAEFFMLPTDPRKEPLRQRLLPMLREAAGVPLSARREVSFDRLRLPAWLLPAENARGTLVIFGGFDSYIEEFFPIFTTLRDEGWNVVAFEGPGQGSVLEEQHAPLISDWHRPVAAVLDAFGLNDVTLIGVSLGGCLAIRAAAFEPRVRRVIAFDVLSDFYATMLAKQPAWRARLLTGLLAVGGGPLVDRIVPTLAQRNPLVEWGVAQARYVFGQERPSEALRAAQAFVTGDVSHHVRQDVLLLAGAEDHYVPLWQLWEQARSLKAAHSITARVFTAEEHAQAHCQVGNLPLAIRVMSSWISSLGNTAS
jgi:alpha-beta hydrolase superfamily lysophospholipase